MYYEMRKEAELKNQIHPQYKPADFEEFWTSNIAALKAIPIEYTREKIETKYDDKFNTYLVKFNTHDDTVVEAYYSVPLSYCGKKLPCVAFYHGGRGSKSIQPAIVETGVCCFAIDVREQKEGSTIDKAIYHSCDEDRGLMTRGVLDHNEFYMKNIYLDAVRAMDVIAQLEEVDAERIVTYGASQGGALSTVASAFSGRSRKCYSIVSSYSVLEKRIEDGTGIFGTTNKFLTKHPEYTDSVMETISYFDMINVVSFLKVQASFCLGLADEICLPSYVYSIYHHADCDKSIILYPFTPHCFPPDFVRRFREEMTELAKL